MIIAICPTIGGMAEWLKAAVLKTVEGNTSVGSNPTPSAIFSLKYYLKPLRRFQFCSISRRTQLLTTGIPVVFRGLKAVSNTEIGQKGKLVKGFTERWPSWLKALAC